MKRRTKGIAIGAIAILFVLFFFFAPVFYWRLTGVNVTGLPHRGGILANVYRSAGCVIFGVGDTYTGVIGFRWGCSDPNDTSTMLY